MRLQHLQKIRREVTFMGYVEAIKVTPQQLTRCDSCNQDGLISSGISVQDSYGVEILWFCFNCKHKYKINK